MTLWHHGMEMKLFFSNKWSYKVFIIIYFGEGYAEVLPLYVHVRRADGQGDHHEDRRGPGESASRPVWDTSLQEEQWVLIINIRLTLLNQNKSYQVINE